MQEDKKDDKDQERKVYFTRRAPQPGNRRYWRRKGLFSRKEGTSVGLASGHNTGTKQQPKGTKVMDPYARLPRSQREAARQADLAAQAAKEPKPKKSKKRKEGDE